MKNSLKKKRSQFHAPLFYLLALFSLLNLHAILTAIKTVNLQNAATLGQWKTTKQTESISSRNNSAETWDRIRIIHTMSTVHGRKKLELEKDQYILISWYFPSRIGCIASASEKQDCSEGSHLFDLTPTVHGSSPVVSRKRSSIQTDHPTFSSKSQPKRRHFLVYKRLVNDAIVRVSTNSRAVCSDRSLAHHQLRLKQVVNMKLKWNLRQNVSG